MKKFSLIIPLFISHFPFKRSYWLFPALMFIPFLSFADKYGCFVQEYQHYIFYNEYKAKGGHPHYLFSSNANNYPDTYYQREGRCPQYTNTPCYLYNYNGSLKATGYVTDFSIEYCPIDDYPSLFYIFTSFIICFSILKIRLPLHS